MIKRHNVTVKLLFILNNKLIYSDMTKIKFAKPQYLNKKYLFKLRQAINYLFNQK